MMDNFAESIEKVVAIEKKSYGTIQRSVEDVVSKARLLLPETKAES